MSISGFEGKGVPKKGLAPTEQVHVGTAKYWGDVPREEKRGRAHLAGARLGLFKGEAHDLEKEGVPADDEIYRSVPQTQGGRPFSREGEGTESRTGLRTGTELGEEMKNSSRKRPRNERRTLS